MPFRFRMGQRHRPRKFACTVRDLIRQHLRTAGKTIEHDLAQWWQMQPHSAHRRMYDPQRALTPEYIDAVVEGLELSEREALRLHRQAALEYGFRITTDTISA